MDNFENNKDGILIVLPFRGTMGEFLDRLRNGPDEGGGGNGLDNAIHSGISCYLQAAARSGIDISQVKICCLGDCYDFSKLPQEQNLGQIKQQLSDLGIAEGIHWKKIYIEGHGEIDPFEKKGYLFPIYWKKTEKKEEVKIKDCEFRDKAAAIDGKEIALALDSLFKVCNCNNVDEIIAANCFGAATEDREGNSVKSVVKTLKEELNFKLSEQQIKGGERELSVAVSKKNSQNISLLVKNNTLDKNIKSNKWLINSFLSWFTGGLHKNDIGLKFDEQFTTEFDKFYDLTDKKNLPEKNKNVACLTWWKNVLYEYGKCDYIRNFDITRLSLEHSLGIIKAVDDNFDNQLTKQEQLLLLQKLKEFNDLRSHLQLLEQQTEITNQLSELAKLAKEIFQTLKLPQLQRLHEAAAVNEQQLMTIETAQEAVNKIINQIFAQLDSNQLIQIEQNKKVVNEEAVNKVSNKIVNQMLTQLDQDLKNMVNKDTQNDQIIQNIDNYEDNENTVKPRMK